MLKIYKHKEPDFFKEFKSKEKPKDWDDFTTEIKKKLKKNMMKKEQKIGGKIYCPYCELELMIEKTQIEHIRPKEKFPELFATYDNFLTGCLKNKTCGQKKGNRWEELFINPVEEDPRDYLTYDIKTGYIIPKTKVGIEYKKSITTIEILNLNENKLVDIRKRFILNILKIVENTNDIDTKKEIINCFDGFPTLKRYLIQNIQYL